MLIWVHPKKVVQRAFWNHVDCLEHKEFLQWDTRTKDHLCANFQDIWLSSKSWILDIKYAISTTKMQISNQFFRKKIHNIVVIRVPSFHLPARSSSFFLSFCLQFYGTTFYMTLYFFLLISLMCSDLFTRLLMFTHGCL